VTRFTCLEPAGRQAKVAKSVGIAAAAVDRRLRDIVHLACGHVVKLPVDTIVVMGGQFAVQRAPRLAQQAAA